MTRSYKLIPAAPLQKGATFHKPRQVLPEQVSADDLALILTTEVCVTEIPEKKEMPGGMPGGGMGPDMY